LQNNVAGQSGFSRDLGGLKVADFADQDGIGVLAHERAKDVGELEVDVGIDLCLRNPG